MDATVQEDNPLIKALPPESDYLTYLTIIEYNLSLENLPVLHKVLQDATLTTNIGWDLVHLLVSMLPDSQQCLHDIARLGNPREVILKVTESLRLIEYEGQDLYEDDDDDGPTMSGAPEPALDADSSTYPLKTATTLDRPTRAGSTQAIELPPPLPLPTSQFIALLSMLAILHGRIKTKSPSRFLSTTLQAILASFSNSTNHREEMILSIVKMMKAIMGTKRPPLPSRRSSSMLNTREFTQTEVPAGDPEALADSQVSPAEKVMQTRLLQSFTTHVLEEYMLNLTSGNEAVPGLAWCSRIMEKLHPERIIPETKTFRLRFTSEESLQRRVDAVGQLLNLAKDLDLKDEELVDAATKAEKVPLKSSEDEDEPPATAADIPLSKLGSLMLYTARQVSNVLYETSSAKSSRPFAIFPDHQEILKHCLSSAAHGTGTLGSEPESLIDAVVSLGLVTLERDAIGEPTSDEQFNEYLQISALLSSNCPSPNLRGHAHYLTTTILRSQPDENVRLAFIRDTLEHCPFENLKVSAVGWIKGETIEANPPTPLAESDGSKPASIFATPFALDTLAPYLFPSLHADIITAPINEAWLSFRTNFAFYVACLNFLYLLLCAKHLHAALSIADLWDNNDIAGSFLQPLRDGRVRFKEGLESGGKLEEDRSGETLAELNVLDEAVQRVTAAVKLLNQVT